VQDLIVAEQKDEGGIGWIDYSNMLKFSYGTCGFFYFFFTCTVAAGV